MLTAKSYLASNLAALGLRNADLAEKLAAVEAPTNLEFYPSADGVPTAALNGRQLCSKHRPLEEADRLSRDINLVENAVVVVMGFGLGYHVQKLAERSDKAVVIVVFEPDLCLLKAALEQIDHQKWLRDALVIFITDHTDRGTLARKLDGAESILAQGVHFLEHPPSRQRLGAMSAEFANLFSEHVAAAKTTLTTTLIRSVETVRNLLLNIDHYAAGAGMAELHNAASGCAAVVVSAGPSLHKNIRQLAAAGVRERCVIIAVQTTLKPLLAAGITPHFVTALDYHEISKRFYEDLDAEALRDVTLIAECKAHPVVLDVFPGTVRCCANGFLDQLLGPQKRDMGTVPAGATVAHLAVYFARFLGCNPIAMIGQDLGFSDGLYYTPGTAIHDVWAPELNPFNTIEMMEWQRIARHRLHLHKVADVHGKSIYTDAQMHTYLQQFERDFAQYKGEGLTIVDATEGGVAKQHTIAMPLAEYLERHATRELPVLPKPASRKLDASRLASARRRINDVRRDVHRLGDVAGKTESLLRTMLKEQTDQSRMAKHFQQVEKHRKEVESRFEAFELINQMNQLGVFRRLKADRKLHMQHGLDPLTRQRAQLERDIENVNWITDSAGELNSQLALATQLLEGKPVSYNETPSRSAETEASHRKQVSRVAVLMAIDPHRNGLGIPRSLAEQFNGVSVLQATLERLGKSKTIESIVLLMAAQHRDAIERLIDRSTIELPVEIEVCTGSPFGEEHHAIAAARLWADTSWRGGLAGISIYDEALCPKAMSEVMQRRGLTAALVVAPDWPLIDVESPEGCDAIVNRHLENPHQHSLVFTQAPPGLCGCVIGASLMQELAQRNRLSTVGGILVYQPHAPQHDPIARKANVQINHRVRNSMVRATFDTPRQRDWIRRTFKSSPATSLEAIESLDRERSHKCDSEIREFPQHITIELTANRTSNGLFRESFGSVQNRPNLTLEAARNLFEQLRSAPDTVVTFGGAGDPLLHRQFDEIVRIAKSVGIPGVHIRTELLHDGSTAMLDRLLNCGVDIVTVDLHADRAATYQAMMGIDRFKDVLINIEYLLTNRRRLTNHPPAAAFGLPWIVPCLQRRNETYEDIDSFFDRWQLKLGAALIEGVPFNEADTLTPAIVPAQVTRRDARRCMTILSNGDVPVDWRDFTCKSVIGNTSQASITDLWRKVCSHRTPVIGECP